MPYATNTGAAASFTMQPGKFIGPGTVYFSYNSTPSGGGLTITDGVNTLSVDITQGGPGFLPIGTFYSTGTITFTLASGGGGVVGKVTFLQNFAGP